MAYFSPTITHFKNMISTTEARQMIHSHVRDFGVEQVPLHQARGRVLRETIFADRDFPPFDRVSMDGVALRFDALAAGQKIFKVLGIVAAGQPKSTLEQQDGCLEVMTGAVMPEYADTVVPYEQVSIANGLATIELAELPKKRNVHHQGKDREAGSEILRAGIWLEAADLGVCATVGKARLSVSRLPKVLIISSGDELVPIGQQPQAHQIRRSNAAMIQTQLADTGIAADEDHLPDDYELIISRLRQHLTNYEVILLSGGVSKGKYDYLPKALEQLGVSKLFHRVRQRPGKPFWFGVYKEQTAVFAFPGNPISTFVCLKYYFEPWLWHSLQMLPPLWQYAKLQQDIDFRPDLTYFHEVTLSGSPSGQLLAWPVRGNGSGDLANLCDADGWIELPTGQDAYQAGEAFRVIPYRRFPQHKS